MVNLALNGEQQWRKLKDQPETLKSLANLTQVKIIPTGTYDLLPLIDLGDQLCRRSKTTLSFKKGGRIHRLLSFLMMVGI